MSVKVLLPVFSCQHFILTNVLSSTHDFNSRTVVGKIDLSLRPRNSRAGDISKPSILVCRYPQKTLNMDSVIC